METIAVIGIDLAKSVFQVHGVNAQGQLFLRKRLSRAKIGVNFDSTPVRTRLREKRFSTNLNSFVVSAVKTVEGIPRVVISTTLLARLRKF